MAQTTKDCTPHKRPKRTRQGMGQHTKTGGKNAIKYRGQGGPKRRTP